MTVPVVPGFGADGAADPGVASRVARAWLAGGLVGLPTETVYGLSADAQDPHAVARIYRVKGRPTGHPLIVHVHGVEALAGWSRGPVALAEVLARHFWPGPLTVVVPRSGRAGDWITGGQPTVALRCPAHPVALACIGALAALSGDPARGVAAPSANRFGRVSPTSAIDVVAELAGRLDPLRDLVVDGGRARVGLESTIVDCTSAVPRVLRLGAISQAEIDAVLASEGGRAGPADSRGAAQAGAARSGDALRDGGAAQAGDAHRGDALRDRGAAQAGDARSDGVGQIRDTGGRGDAAPAVRAPGSLDSHYAPAARVRVVERAAWPAPEATPADERRGLIAEAGIATPTGWSRLAAPRSVEEYAHLLYAALRAADDLGVDEVVAVPPDLGAGPLAAAVRDRLARAAHPDRPRPTP